VVVSPQGAQFVGATEPPGGRHAEIVALDAAGEAARGGTLYVTLEPCVHQGRTGPCTEAILGAGVARVVVGVADSDPLVGGGGLAALRDAGVEVLEGVAQAEIAEQLAPYLHHRSTGRPWVVLKMAATLDGRTAAADGTSRWITGDEARADVHRLRAICDAVLVGAGTVRADDPELTVRSDPAPERQPLRVVLGAIPEDAQVLPARSMSGDLGEILDELGAEGVVQLLVEGGAGVAHDFLAADLVDRLVLYLAPALLGGDDGAPLLSGPGAPTIEALRRGRFVSVSPVGDDLRLEVEI
jgi:diaminohydroxyphosphoribosylaminopyrimidine deaminase/5-amino-6-(5-phosphoribosylamino)uracil reductase